LLKYVIKRSFEIMRKYSFYLVVFPLCLLVLSGCGKLERKGTSAANVPPKVYFANIPPVGTKFSTNPEVHWFGTDIDGFITAYQYAVMVKDSVFSRWDSVAQVKSLLHDIPPDSVSWVDQITLMDMLGTHAVAEPGGHTRDVMMYADTVDTIYTPQYIFLRAVDNRGAVSEVEHLMLSRNNHRPKALIDMVDSATQAAFTAKGHYCLEETTATWKGISISWKGWDSLDYPEARIQPDFQFKWELVGPFEDSLESPFEPETTASFVVDSSLDSALISGKWHPLRWVSEKTHVFKGLENSGDLGYGWYQLRVRARDDALVSHDTAATLNFRILKPEFRYADSLSKTILVVDATAYRNMDGGAADPGDVRPFYEKALTFLKDQQPPLCDEWEMWYDPNTTPDKDKKSAPGEDILSQYDLTIVLNLGSKPAISEDNYKAYKEYMNIGGRLWLIGLNNFRSSGARKPEAVSDFVTQYFGIDEVFVPSWTPADSMTLEFIQAKSFGLWGGLPTLEADPTECEDLKGYNSTIPGRNFGVRGIPYVCYEALSNKLDFAKRIPYQRRIYTFISYYGSISPMHEKPCAVNYIGSTYRTAEFCFPLNLMKNESPDQPVFKVMEEMVKWFWEDLP
jgi:hypothetical protein